MRLYGTITLATIALLHASWARADADAGEPPSPSAASPASDAALPETPALKAHDAALRSQIEAETDAKIKKAQDQLRDEMRADMVTAGASAPSEAEQVPAEKPKLQFLELNGYFRVRPNLYDNLWLGWTQPDPLGYYPFPKPYVNDNGKTILSSDMRFRIEPTFNVSEDIRLKAQIDVLDNVVLGSTPNGPYSDIDMAAGAPNGLAQPTTIFSNTQLSPANSISAKRIWAEVMTPVGQLRFGRMGNNWGMGLYQNDGNCLDCDYGNTVDRIMFIAKIANHYIIPMIDFVGSGPLYNPYESDQLGQPIAIDHDLEAYEYVLAIARKDTEEEIHRDWDEGKASINYGLYFAYRNQSNDLIGYQNPNSGVTPPALTINSTGQITNLPAGAIDATNANFFTPDLWFRYQTKRLRLEAEGVYSYGTFSTLFDPGSTTEHEITVSEFGGAAQGEYHFLSDGSLTVGVELGLASGEDDPGFGNNPGRSYNASGPIQTPGATGSSPGAIDGRKFYCVNNTAPCPEASINNYTFNQDYHVDMILWREIIGGVTGAWYARPNIKYTLIEGLDLSLSIIYSESWYAASTPGNQLPLGVEFDGAIRYKTDDGFIASLEYGLLVPLGGLGETLNDGTFLSPSVAQAVRLMLGVKY